MRITEVVFDEANEEHATAHGISLSEIVQVLTNSPTVRRNRKNRSAEYTATGTTDGGRRVLVAFTYDDGAARPITAWEMTR